MEKYSFLDGYEKFGGDKLIVTKEINPDLLEVINAYEGLEYIGTGNPDAEVLFIGKEMAIDLKEHEDQYKATVSQNITKWKNQQNGYEIVSGPKGNYWDFFSPWFPYYRQNNLIRIEPNEKEGTKQKKPDNGGTSRTEYYYQRIISAIYVIPEAEKQFLSLHMYAFLSELTTATAPKSAEVNPDERKQSIKNRKVLWQTLFFQSFPITILGIGPNKDYIIPGTDREDVINIEKDFKVKCIEKLNIRKKFINVHFSEDGKRMLLHTSHLSASSNELVEKISVLCREFLDGRATNKGQSNVEKYIKNQGLIWKIQK